MGKRRVDEQAVGQLVLPIGPCVQATSNQAPLAEAMPPEASTGADAVGEERKRKWYTLYDKVCKKGTLYEAFKRVRANKGASGCDGMTIEQVDEDPKPFLRGLRKELREKRYHPRPVRRCTIPKAGGGERHLGIPTVRDRIVQTGLVAILEPIFEAKFSERSHGFRPQRGCQTALGAVWEALEDGYEWVVDADIKAFFDTVDHEVLLAAVNEEIADGSVLRLIEMFLKTGIMADGVELTPEEGTPQGGPLSPLLANIYLHPLDATLEAGGLRFVRYADDFVVFARTRQEAEEALTLIRELLGTLKLSLNEEKTRIVHIDDGFDFLGFRHFRHRCGGLQRVVRKKSQAKFRDAVRERSKRHAGQRRRKLKSCKVAKLQRDQRLMRMIGALNRYLRSWYGYFREGTRYVASDFRTLDKFVRRRVRSAITGRFSKSKEQSTVLTKRLLADLGLISLLELHKAHFSEQLPPPISG
jgi:RNA-directed DNA polymerase